MVDNEYILTFDDYPFDVNRLWAEYHNIKDHMEPYTDPRGEVADWAIKRVQNFDYALELDALFGIVSKPRFYDLDANCILPPHIDYNTQCSINIVLNPSEQMAPVSFGDGNEFYYQCCLLNTTKMHSVNNGPENRILFKMSIFDWTFDEVKEKIKRIYD